MKETFLYHRATTRLRLPPEWMSLAFEQIMTLSIFGEGLFYGIFWALFFIVVFHQVSSTRSNGGGSWGKRAMFMVAVIMFLDSTLHMAFVLIEALTSHALTPTIAFIAPLHILLGDAVLVWRVWAVLRNKRFVFLPLVAFILTIGFAIESAVRATQERATFVWSLPTTILTICNTVSCTLFIAWKIWKIQQIFRAYEGAASSRRDYTGVIYLIIESGAICTTGHIITLVLAESGSNVAVVALRMLIPLAGILQTGLMVIVYYQRHERQKTSENTDICFTNPHTTTVITVDTESDPASDSDSDLGLIKVASIV